MLFALAWAAWFLRLLRRGEIDVRQDGRRMAQMVWVFTLLMVIFMVILGASTADRAKGTIVILQSFVFLIGAAVYWLTQRIEHADRMPADTGCFHQAPGGIQLAVARKDRQFHPWPARRWGSDSMPRASCARVADPAVVQRVVIAPGRQA